MQDGAGLMLDRSDSGGKWVFRYSFARSRRIVMDKWAHFVTGASGSVARTPISG